MEFEIQKKKGLYSVISYLIIFNLISAIISGMVVNIYKSMNLELTIAENYYQASSLINLIVYVILFAVLVYIYNKDLLNEGKEFKKKDKPLIRILAGYGIFYAINVFISLIVSNIDYYSNLISELTGSLGITTTADNQTTIEAILNSNGFWMMILSAGILGPICEELVFRKAIFSLFKQKELGILVSSLCFGLIHVISSFGQYDLISTIVMTVPYIASGVAFGIIYIKNDCNLFVPTIVHMLSNIISIFGIMFLS